MPASSYFSGDPKTPKTVNQPSARTMTGLRRDPSGKMRLYVFGFTRNNA